MTKTVTFDGAAPAGTINFGIGQPSADLLPVDLVQQASRSFFDGAEPFELNYGVTQGDERFLDSLAGFLTKSYGVPTSSNELFVTGGNSQALDLGRGPFRTRCGCGGTQHGRRAVDDRTNGGCFRHLGA